MRIQHVLVTMLNRRLGGRRGFRPDLELDEQWLLYRWKLFTTYTVPSVAAQSEKDFTWLVLCHSASPAWLRELTSAVIIKADVHFSFSDPDPVLGQFGGADALLVTRIDSDDFWHRQAMERIREDCEADPYTSEIVTVTDGYLLDDKARRMRPYYHFSPPFCTKINLGPNLDPLDLGGSHSLVRRRFRARSISDGEPMFVAVVHGRNTSRSGHCDPADSNWLTPEATAGILRRDFGVMLGTSGGAPVGAPAAAGHSHASKESKTPPPRPPTRGHQRVVVSIPCFQAWGSVGRAAESILGQTHHDVLAVVASDGDAQPRWDVLSHIDDPRLIRIDYPVNRGRYFIDQIALMARLGQYLLIHDADEWSEPDRVQALVEEMRRNHGIAAVSPYYHHVLGPSGPAAVIDLAVLPSPVMPAYPRTPQPTAGSRYRGAFSAQQLLNVGGCYGGYRDGYGGFLFQLLRMTGTVARTDRPLYHCLPHSAPSGESDGGGPNGEFIPPYNGLARMSEEAYHVYCEYLQGYVSFSILCQQLRTLAWRHVRTSEWEALHNEVYRLRWHVKAAGVQVR